MPVVGSIEDLSNAKLDDVHKWFSSYYGPNNAVVVVAGDIDAKPGVELSKVEKAIDEELTKFLAEGPTAKELEGILGKKPIT